MNWLIKAIVVFVYLTIILLVIKYYEKELEKLDNDIKEQTLRGNKNGINI